MSGFGVGEFGIWLLTVAVVVAIVVAAVRIALGWTSRNR
jgi:hypothetical protein